MTLAILAAAMLLSGPQQEPLAAAPPQVDVADGVVAGLVEDLRKAELVLDADELADRLAYSFTLVDRDGRVSGSFAYLEPMRRLRERGGQVKELRFDTLMVRAYGSSAVATYELHMSWVDGGVRHRSDGWSTDVFEKRDDGAWVLVHRHRP